MNPIYRKHASPIRKLLAMKAAGGGGTPETEYTATGNPLSFETNVAKALTQSLVGFSPYQSGTGDPSPENIRPISGTDHVNVWRTGKNLFDKSNKTVLNAYIDRTSIVVSVASRTVCVPCKPNTTYTISKTLSARFSVGYIKDATPATGKTVYEFSTNNAGTSIKVTTGDGATWLVIWIYTSQYDTLTLNQICDTLQVEIGSTATEYTPYSGEYYSVVFPALGKNLITGTGYGGTFYNAGVGTDLAKTTSLASFTESNNVITVTATSGWSGCIFATDLLQAGTYTVHTELGGEDDKRSCYVTDSDLIVKTRYSLTSDSVSITLTEASRIVVFIGINPAGSGTVTNLQVESGSYTSWEPYTSTAYGGTLDLATGVLTVEWKNAIIKDLTWVYANAGYFYINVTDHKQPPSSGGLGLLCSAIPYGGTKGASAFEDGYIYDNAYSKSIYIKDTSCADTDALKTKYGNYSIAYPLDEPVTYQLTPQEITTIANSVNVLWSDTNESMTVKYLKKG